MPNKNIPGLDSTPGLLTTDLMVTAQGANDYNATLAQLATLVLAQQSGSDVLTKLLTVDGAGSGLDADLLDGLSSTHFTNASNLSSGTIPSARFPAVTSTDNATSGGIDFGPILNNYQLRWGRASSSSDAAQTFNFSSAFSTSCYGVLLTITGPSTSRALCLNGNPTASNFSIDRGDTLDGIFTFNYLAWGK